MATSSTRRAAQLLAHRPDLQITPIRGNVGTRLRKLAQQPETAATILAAAGLERLGYQVDPATGRLSGPETPDGLFAHCLSLEEMLPCVGQAALGLEVREGDPWMRQLCDQFTHVPTRQCVEAERAFLRALGGGCQLAVAALASLSQDQLRLRVVSFLREQAVRAEGSDAPDQAVVLGRRLAQKVLS